MLKTENGRAWATISEAAKKLGVSKARLAKAAREGKIDALRLSPRVILIDWQQATFWRERYYSKRKAKAIKRRLGVKEAK
jgi:excisionase family DNA binding protein